MAADAMILDTFDSSFHIVELRYAQSALRIA
jgi:hypothetical protein